MRTRLIVGVLALSVLSGCGTSSGDKPTPPPSKSMLAPQTITAGAVEVTLKPQRLDDAGATFSVSFDTHSVDLGLDVASASRLTVDGVAWGAAKWSGSATGGHHRAGTLTFSPAGRTTGRAVLTIGGLPQPVEASWTLGATS